MTSVGDFSSVCRKKHPSWSDTVAFFSFPFTRIVAPIIGSPFSSIIRPLTDRSFANSKAVPSVTGMSLARMVLHDKPRASVHSAISRDCLSVSFSIILGF